MFQAAGYPGMHANMEAWNALTRTATATIAFGAPGQRNGDNGVAPLASGGEFIGLAVATHAVTVNGDLYVLGDTVPIADEGVWFGKADAAIAAGAALNWNSATGRWTTAATSGTIFAVQGAEADSAASGADAIFKVRLRRIPS
ncbi:hypothetical protein CLG96_00180 [Sphingomonas oleivorans]|uniref:DUF2190 domain-containing protein n=2 Tax=Sphingomonas oleivorans TaxID=1735121 RepID=A0A2T5G3E1_9SPHN|nr:hypothetical protein CLG96_00180 [Sphingomonas oleivorans]